MPEIKQNEDKNRHRGMKKYWNRSLLNDIINYYLSSLFSNSWTLSNLSLRALMSSFNCWMLHTNP